MGKTDSIKQRSIYVYLPSVELVKDWKAKAKKSSASISRFVIEHVTNSLRQEEGEEAYKSRAELMQQIREKDEQIQKLTRENEITKLALERVENELERYRAAPFLEEDFKGIRRYDRRLIELLKKGEAVDSDHLLRLLKIDPRDTPLVKAISNQLGNLEAYGLVEKTRRGWKWVS
jgi:ribosomal protein L16 Arg81 hydroxylase